MTEQKSLLVISNVKKLFKASGMNTSLTAIKETNQYLEGIFAKAVFKAKEDGRKTVMERDIKAVLEDEAN